MGKAPAIIIVTRHGSRLDSEDKTWTATSATPYDTPLSYGGWIQTRALGARIASLLHARQISLSETDSAAARRSPTESSHASAADETPQPSKTKRRKHKVIIHSSPFLRCVQSSIAICAGIAQYQGNLKKFEATAGKLFKPKTPGPPARSKTLDLRGYRSKYGTEKEESDASTSTSDKDTRPDFIKPTLRIDACLGEWLTPEYYEFITAPPSSSMMVAGAKADLLRPSTPIQGAKLDDTPHGSQNDMQPLSEPSSSLSMTSLKKALPHQPYQALPTAANGYIEKRDFAPVRKPVRGYRPPVPSYAISAHQPIPAGFVAHAREHCVDMDFRWDSMRQPQNWGDGGEHGEEWSSMHRRLRRCLMCMITWYKEQGPFYDPQEEPGSKHEDESLEEEEDIVIVIVTHGAGCNALIGALTNQPVLLDVGMASLTMAVHKGTEGDTRLSRKISPNQRRRSSVDVSQSEEYDVKLIASSEHLRAGADPLTIPLLRTPGPMASIPEHGSRDSYFFSGSSGSNTPPSVLESDHPASKNAALGSIRRTRATTATSPGEKTYNSYGARQLSPHPTGLWSNAPNLGPAGRVEEEDSDSANLTLSFADADAEKKNTEVQSPIYFGEGQGRVPKAADQPLDRSDTSHGLWTAGAKQQPARRWTLEQKR